jgi:hypothetical protein
MSDEQRKAMFARMGGGGRIPAVRGVPVGPVVPGADGTLSFAKRLSIGSMGREAWERIKGTESLLMPTGRRAWPAG